MDDQGAAPAKEPNDAAPKRDPLLSAILSLSGELGYRQATAKLIAARANQSVGFLYTRYSGREECFAAAYDEFADPLLLRILAAGRREPSPEERIRAGLAELFAFAGTEPLIARALVSEVYVAGGAALDRHEQILRRLSRALAGTRRESDSSRHDSPPIAASFIVGGLETVVRRRLQQRRPDLLWEELPYLVNFASAPFQRRS